MKEKLKEFSKSYLVGLILGIIVSGTIGVIAATYFPSNQTTYDNTNTELQSTNVQDAIDELYGVCFPPGAGDQILDNTDIVTSGDGLYEDEYEDGKYTYKGANPNNYVTFNNEEAGWRIISINSDGTIKILYEGGGIKARPWDSSDSNNWARPATLNTYLNGEYYDSLSSTAKNQIVESTYYAGAVTNSNNDMQDQINDEKSTTSKVKVALATLSEYIRACSNTNCKTLSTYQKSSNRCINSDWMYKSNIAYWWTLSPNSDYFDRVFYVNNGGTIYSDNVRTMQAAIRPVVTLSSEVKITGGTGTQSDPFQIE